jgi:hypothetical protein
MEGLAGLVQSETGQPREEGLAVSSTAIVCVLYGGNFPLA